jgi:hypothetical protein
MVSGSHKGEWFLPGKEKFPGQLVIDNKQQTIHLEIFAPFFIEGPSINLDTHPEHFHTIILGDHPVCTLYNCHLAGTEEVGANLYRTTYRIEYVFTSVHFNDPTITVYGGTFIYSHLATWYDGDELHDKLEGKGGLFVDGKEVIENVLRKEELQVNTELSLVLWDEVNKNIKELDISYCVKYEKYLRFQYQNSVPFKRLLKDAISFLKLLSFCFGKPMNLFIVYAYADLKKATISDRVASIRKSDRQIIHVNNYTLKRGKEIAEHSAHGRHMIVSRHTLSKDELNGVIVQWFANERLYGIYEYYLDSNNWFEGAKAKLSNVMFNNRFLNLIQGIEAYYNEYYPRKLTPSPVDQQLFTSNKQAVIDLIKDEHLKTWVEQELKFKKAREFTLKEKLTALITDLKPDLEDLFQNILLSEFPESATKFRNILSHGGNKEINLGVRLHEDYYIAQILLGICILKSLGVAELKERVAYYSRFEDAAYQIYHFQLQRRSSNT